MGAKGYHHVERPTPVPDLLTQYSEEQGNGCRACQVWHKQQDPLSVETGAIQCSLDDFAGLSFSQNFPRTALTYNHLLPAPANHE
jgi:hypothetical protein